MSEQVEIKVGQVWRDWDSRSRKPDAPVRLVKILEIVDGKAICQHPGGLGRKTKIKLSRFRPTSNGYKLEKDVEAAPSSS